MVAFSGATHDIALDGLYMAELSEQDQAKYIGWQGASSHEAALHAWTVIMDAAAVLLMILSLNSSL